MTSTAIVNSSELNKNNINNMNNCYNKNVNKCVMQLNANTSHSTGNELHLTEIGPIPPPRMFSDSVHNHININNITIETNSYQKSYEDNDSSMDSTNDMTDGSNRSQTSLEVPQMSNSLPICLIRSHFVNEPISVVEEVPTKEPQLSAVPKKSALKKPRITNSDNETQKQTQSPTQVMVNCNTTSNTSSPSPMIIRPQPSPRCVYNSAVQQTPMQIVVTSTQHNSPHNSHNLSNGSVIALIFVLIFIQNK